MRKEFRVARELVEAWPFKLNWDFKILQQDYRTSTYLVHATSKIAEDAIERFMGSPMSKMFAVKRCVSMFESPAGPVQCGKQDDGHVDHLCFVSNVWLEWTSDQAFDPFKPVARIGAFTGWRCWRLNQADVTVYSKEAPRYSGFETQFRLMSTAAEHVWQSPVMTTQDLKRVSPMNVMNSFNSKFDFGVYSYKTPLDLVKYFRLPSGNYPVIGRLDLTGHIVEHEFGWRAQKSVIRELWFAPPWEVAPKSGILKEITEQFERTYSCDIHLLESDQVEHWAKWYDEDQSQQEKNHG
jgi:hypothetical protein